jgi:hypothetical protein
LNKRRSNKERLERREAKVKWRLEKIQELKNKKMASQFMTDLEATLIPPHSAKQVDKADTAEQADKAEPADQAEISAKP